MTASLLFEIGTEEIPASWVVDAIESLSSNVVRLLTEQRLDVASDNVRVLGTPRRLTVMVTDLKLKQNDVIEDIIGPPASLAFDADGNPTQVAKGFASKQNVILSDLKVTAVKGKKGDYVVYKKTEKGRETKDIVPQLLTSLLKDIPWRKSMRWASYPDSFARPIHWIVAMYDHNLVPLSFGGVSAGTQTYGHRFSSPQHIDLSGDHKDYIDRLRNAFVLVDPQERKEAIEQQIHAYEQEHQWSVCSDPELLDEVVFLVEYPVVLLGELNTKFLELPREVIISAMRSHQRYFAVQDNDGDLENRFITVAGSNDIDRKVVIRGNNRVLAARLADAEFFYQHDTHKKLESWNEKLQTIVLHEYLGTLWDKVQRMTDFSRLLIRYIDDKTDIAVDTEVLSRAVLLCKADLSTGMVREFPELQGVMGGYYARLSESDKVALAIKEHYLPRGVDSALPTTSEGALLSVIDRIDTIVGGFCAGIEPTGSSDPYALRREAIGVLHILEHYQWDISITSMIELSLSVFEENNIVNHDDKDKIRDKILLFFKTRLRNLLTERFSSSCVDAALSADYDHVSGAIERTKALEKFLAQEDFRDVIQVCKRVSNIIKDKSSFQTVDPSQFQEKQEEELWQALGVVKKNVDRLVLLGDYESALRSLADIQIPTDRFFEAVLVMDKNQDLRNNRLSLLYSVHSVFSDIADFRCLL